MLCLFFNAMAQDAILNKKVSFNYVDTPLEAILKDLNNNYGIKFSYVNNLLPLQQKITAKASNQPLYEGLTNILLTTEVDFKVVNGQVVLKKIVGKKSAVKPSKQVKSGDQNEEKQLPANQKDEAPITGKKEEMVEYSKEEVPLKEAATSGQQPVPEEEPGTEPNISVSVPEEKAENVLTDVPEGEIQNSGEVQKQIPAPNKEGKFRAFLKKTFSKKEKEASVQSEDDPKNKKNALKKERENNKEPMEGLATSNEVHEKVKADESNAEEIKPLHIGFIFPLSSNFIKAPEYTNHLSFHALVGVSKGLEGVEVSGFGNVTKQSVKGSQIAGFFNVTGGAVEGVQAAGFTNISRGSVRGAQFAGFINIGSDSAYSTSFAGFGNIRNGYVKGGQFAGFINTAEDIKGVQAAGFINTAKDVHGTQLAGFINKARKVKGVQIGVINFADTVDGISLGIFNFVKHGYRRLEFFGTEAFHANVAFKIGVPKFYTIIAGGAKFQEDFTWGYGFGFGSQFNMSDSWKLSLDLTSNQVMEGQDRHLTFDKGRYYFNSNYLNINNNLKVGFDKVFHRYFAITFGPTFNVMVSKRENILHGEHSTFAPYYIFNRTSANNNVKMWPGFFVGVRI